LRARSRSADARWAGCGGSKRRLVHGLPDWPDDVFRPPQPTPPRDRGDCPQGSGSYATRRPMKRGSGTHPSHALYRRPPFGNGWAGGIAILRLRLSYPVQAIDRRVLHISPHSVMMTGSLGRLLGPVATFSILRSVSRPSISLPKTTCLPSKKSHLAHVMKNCARQHQTAEHDAIVRCEPSAVRSPCHHAPKGRTWQPLVLGPALACPGSGPTRGARPTASGFSAGPVPATRTAVRTIER